MKNKAKILPEGKKTAVFQQVYPINEPYVYAAVVTEPNSQRIRYELIEPTLLEEEEKQLKEIKDILVEEIDVNLNEITLPYYRHNFSLERPFGWVRAMESRHGRPESH